MATLPKTIILELLRADPVLTPTRLHELSRVSGADHAYTRKIIKQFFGKAPQHPKRERREDGTYAKDPAAKDARIFTTANKLFLKRKTKEEVRKVAAPNWRKLERTRRHKELFGLTK